MGEALAFVGKLIDWVKSPATTAVGVLGSLFFLYGIPRFFPTEAKPMAPYRMWAVCVLTVSLAGFVVSSVRRIIEVARARWVNRKRREDRKRVLYSLTPEQQFILALYLQEQSTTQYFAYDHGVVHSLINSEILYVTTPFVTHGQMSFTMPLEVYEFLSRNPVLLARRRPPSASPSEQF
jgi:hypothetical protein